MFFSVNYCVLLVAVLWIASVMNSNTAINLTTASLLVTEQALSSYKRAETEIASVAVNGNALNTDTATAATTTTIIATNATATTEPRRVLKRGKRYLDFLSSSRISFRMNGKNNIISNLTLWAHGYGFRANFPLQNDKRVRPFRRDTYEALGDLMEKSGFDGQACILKAFCVAHMDDTADLSKGMLFKLLKYVFTLNDDEKRHFPYLRHENCHQILHSHCPLSFNNISPFTDDV